MPDKLRQYKMLFERVTDGHQLDAVDLGLSSKLGGDPDWQQGEEWPDCLSCQRPMTFVAQIDSMEHDNKNNPHRIDCLSGEAHFMFGDVGLIYVFLCFECLESRNVVQCG
jgi:uncharacterized protein YwqG